MQLYGFSHLRRRFYRNCERCNRTSTTHTVVFVHANLSKPETDIVEKDRQEAISLTHVQQILQTLDRTEQYLGTRKKRTLVEMDDADIATSALLIHENNHLPTNHHQVPTVSKNLPVPGSKKAGTQIPLLERTSLDIATAASDEWIDLYSSGVLFPVFSSDELDSFITTSLEVHQGRALDWFT